MTAYARICMHRKKINIATVLPGQWLGLKKSTSAFGSSSSCTTTRDISTWTTRSARGCYPCLRKRPVTHVSGLDKAVIGAGEGIRTLDPNLGKVVLYP